MPFIPYAPYQQTNVVSPTVSRQHSERLPTVEEDDQEELVDDSEKVSLPMRVIRTSCTCYAPHIQLVYEP